MTRSSRFIPLLTILLAAAASAQDKPAASRDASKDTTKDKVDFAAQVWPILQSTCIECHATPHIGDDGKKTKPKGNIVLDTKEGISTSKKGKLIVAKKPADSLLLEAITRAPDAKKRMPPAKKADPLSKEQTDLIKKWIEQGASFGTWTGKNDDKADAKKNDDKKGGKTSDPAGDKPKAKDDKGKGGDKKSGG